MCVNYGGLLEALDKYGLKTGVIITEEQEKTFTRDGCTVKVLPMYK